MKRAWRIEFRYWNYSNLAGDVLTVKQFEPRWIRSRSTFATREAAERYVTSGDLGYYLSFARKHEYRVFSVDHSSGGTT